MLIPLVGRHSLVLIGGAQHFAMRPRRTSDPECTETSQQRTHSPCTGDEWRTHRSILQKAFHSSYNAFFMDCMVDASRALIRFLSAAQRYDCIDLDHHFTKLSVRAPCVNRTMYAQRQH